MSSDDLVTDVAEGATKGALDWSAAKIKELAAKFRNRELVFIEEQDTIDLAIEQRKTSEWVIFKDYIQNKDYRILFQMGLTLRSLEKNGGDLRHLKKRIKNKYDNEGLHIAQFVQNGILNKYLGIVLDRLTTPQRLSSEIKKLFDSIENTTAFVKTEDKIKNKTDQIVTKINAHSPKIFIIFSAGHAIDLCEKIKNNVTTRISNYTSEIYATENEHKRIYFLIQKEDEL